MIFRPNVHSLRWKKSFYDPTPNRTGSLDRLGKEKERERLKKETLGLHKNVMNVNRAAAAVMELSLEQNAID